MTDAQTWATDNLTAFKQRMRITTNDPDEVANLTSMLTASYTAILRLVGTSDATDPEVQELIIERARYNYNDALDEFLGNYGAEIRNVFLANQPADTDDDSEDTA